MALFRRTLNADLTRLRKALGDEVAGGALGDDCDLILF